MLLRASMSISWSIGSSEPVFGCGEDALPVDTYIGWNLDQPYEADLEKLFYFDVIV